MAFKRNEGFRGSIPQRFIDNNVIKCPICGTNDPHWSMEMKFTLDIEGNRYRYKCEKCGCILSALVPDVAGFNKTAITTTGFIKKMKGKQNKAVYMKVDDIGNQSSMSQYVGKEMTLSQLNSIQPNTYISNSIQNNKFCNKCGNPIQTNDVFCSKCGNPLENENKFCSKCGNPLENEDMFCSKCGNSVK